MPRKYVNTSTVFALSAGVFLFVGSAVAQDYTPQGRGSFIIDLRASDVSPDTSSRIVTASGVDSGLHVHVGDSVMPTLGFTYFLTNQLAVEAILGTTEHTISAQGAGTDVKVRSTWVLPPVVSLQYHPWPKARLSPYVGAGVNAMIYYGGDNANGFKVRLKDNVGEAVQGGADLALKGPWALNVDVKKVFVETDAVINDGALHSNVHLDPWVVSMGVGRRF
jgi:outer membrane protein